MVCALPSTIADVVEMGGCRPGSDLDRRIPGGASGLPIHRMHPMARWRIHPNGDRWGAPIAPRVNPVLPIEKPDNGERLSLEVFAKAVRRLLFATCVLLGLAFALVCYAEMLGIVLFD